MADNQQNGPKSFMDILNDILVQKYGKKIVEYGEEPKNFHSLRDANGYVSYTGPCGDTMKIWVKIEADVIEDIGFQTDGCDCTRAVGSMLTEMVKGAKIAEALEVTPLQIDEALDGLPDDHKHCAVLARDALHKVIRSYQEQQPAQ